MSPCGLFSALITSGATSRISTARCHPERAIAAFATVVEEPAPSEAEGTPMERRTFHLDLGVSSHNGSARWKRWALAQRSPSPLSWALAPALSCAVPMGLGFVIALAQGLRPGLILFRPSGSLLRSPLFIAASIRSIHYPLFSPTPPARRHARAASSVR